MRLSRFIIANMEPLLVEWETMACSMTPAADNMDSRALRDHAQQILVAIAADMETGQSREEQKDKSTEPVAAAVGTAAGVHGELRQVDGFDLPQLVAEYRALRASVLRLWTEKEAPGPESLREMTRFNEAVDQAFAESATRFAEEAAKSRDIFMAILGHDLRSPLNAITMSAHSLDSPSMTPELRTRAVTVIQGSARSMGVMIRDLLDFAAIRLGQAMPMNAEPANLGTVARGALDEVQASYPRCTFELRSEGELDGDFDKTRIRQTLANLLTNAVHHGDAKHAIQLRLRRESDWLVAEVANQGKPIDPDLLAVIFNPLARDLDRSATGSSGLGLGLHIAREIAQVHGGTITAASTAKETAFTIRLPRRARQSP